jgi:hypothetical protein
LRAESNRTHVQILSRALTCSIPIGAADLKKSTVEDTKNAALLVERLTLALEDSRPVPAAEQPPWWILTRPAGESGTKSLIGPGAFAAPTRNVCREQTTDSWRIKGKRVIDMNSTKARFVGQHRSHRALLLLASLGLILAPSGCFRVHVDKDANGDDKNVQVDTPFGGVHVNTDQTSAADLGLPVYPGAQPITGDDKHKSADVHLGFGEWELRVRAVSYGTPDSQDKVAAFYKKALGRYGDVITCQEHAAIGSPATTSQGLTCADEGNHGAVQVDHNDLRVSGHNIELKAGSHRHQHIVGFDDPKDGQTRFALVALDLPGGSDKGSNKSD